MDWDNKGEFFLTDIIQTENYGNVTQEELREWKINEISYNRIEKNCGLILKEDKITITKDGKIFVEPIYSVKKKNPIQNNISAFNAYGQITLDKVKEGVYFD